jgi:hypothetical protein
MMLIMTERTTLCPSKRVSSGVCPNKVGCHSLNISLHLIENLGGRTSTFWRINFLFSFYHLTSLSGRNPISVRVRKSEKILDFILATIRPSQFRRMSFLDGEEKKKTFSGQRGKIKLNMEKERIKKVQYSQEGNHYEELERCRVPLTCMVQYPLGFFKFDFYSRAFSQAHRAGPDEKRALTS